ncbi:MAG: LysR family transcriptional regulator [Sphingomonas fennica]
MDTLLNIRAFLAIADAGSLSAAARKLGVAPSIVSKRIARLEDEMGVRLFERTTRKVAITTAGSRILPRFRILVQEMDEALRGARGRPLEGTLRIKSPTTIALAFMGRFFIEFQQRHPEISIDLVLLDRSVNPIEDGFDIALGAQPISYVDIVDVPLCPYPRTLVASPDYVAAHGMPGHPRDLVAHECICLQSTGSHWVFVDGDGEVSVSVRSRFTVNESGVLHDAACRGRGVTILPDFVAGKALAERRLLALLPAYPVKPMGLKALIPSKKADQPIVQLLVDEMRDYTRTPPWERGPAAVDWAI